MLPEKKDINSNVIPFRGHDDSDRNRPQHSIADIATDLKNQLIEVQQYKKSIGVLDDAIQQLRATALDYQAGLQKLKVGPLRRRANRLYSIMNQVEMNCARS